MGINDGGIFPPQYNGFETYEKGPAIACSLLGLLKFK
jgi:hypothetical protein